MLSVYDVRIEYQKNPIGIDVREPRVSWKIKSDDRNIRQATYQIQVSKEESFDNVVWDSDEVASDESIHIVLKDLKPESKTRYYVRVRVTDLAGNESGWSEPSFFEMGLLEASEWQAKWISTPESMDEKASPQFRFSFKTKEIGRAHV